MPLSPHLLPRFEQELRLRNYRPNTVRTYTNALRAYVRWLGPRPAREVEPEVVREYLWSLVESGRSRSYVDQAISALKFLYVELYRKCTAADFPIDRPRRESTLPHVLSRRDVLRLADAVQNRRHRLAVLVLYAAGLRVSELIGANVADVDLARRTLHVRMGKGGKGRYTVLSERLLEDLAWIIGERGPKEPLIPPARANAGRRAACNTWWSAPLLRWACRRAATRSATRSPRIYSKGVRTSASSRTCSGTRRSRRPPGTRTCGTPRPCASCPRSEARDGTPVQRSTRSAPFGRPPPRPAPRGPSAAPSSPEATAASRSAPFPVDHHGLATTPACRAAGRTCTLAGVVLPHPLANDRSASTAGKRVLECRASGYGPPMDVVNDAPLCGSHRIPVTSDTKRPTSSRLPSPCKERP